MPKSCLLIIMSCLLLLLQACSTGKVVPGYEGDVLSKAELGLLEASDNISVLSINGKEMPQYLLSSISTTYGLKPGINQVVFEYESVWATAKRAANAERAVTLKSKPLLIELDVKAGQVYRFSYDVPETMKEAKALVEDMKVTVYDAQEKVAALSEVYDANKKVAPIVLSNQATQQDVLIDKVSVSSPTKQLNIEASTATEALKAIWAEMSAKEQKEFLVWAFQE